MAMASQQWTQHAINGSFLCWTQMPKQSKYPKLRSHIRRGKSGQVWTYYTYDMRGTGEPDINLGSDHAKAVDAWRKIRDGEHIDRGLIREAITRWAKEELPKYTNSKTRADYQRHADRLLQWCGGSPWSAIGLPQLVRYAQSRSAPTQANRELAVLSIIWGRARVWGMTKLPWPAAGVKNWRNREKARASRIDMEVFERVYQEGSRMLRHAMDIASATAMRLTDVREADLPVNDKLVLQASKTAKAAYFVVSKSATLSRVVNERLSISSFSSMLLVNDDGSPVSERQLREAWRRAKDAAASRAAQESPELAGRIREAWARDLRKLAANLAGNTAKAKELLQHSTDAVTRKHYRTEGDELPATR